MYLMLHYGHSYYIISRDEEMIYKKSSKKSVFETFSHKRKYNMILAHVYMF